METADVRGALEHHTQPGHEHTPEPGTVYTSTGLPVTVGDATQDNHPLEAVCAGCGQPIRREREFLDDWQRK
jgi:hypothetical protein